MDPFCAGVPDDEKANGRGSQPRVVVVVDSIEGRGCG